MAFVDASGLAPSSATPLARGVRLVLSEGISESICGPEGAGAMIHAGKAVSACLVTCLGKLEQPVAIALAAATTSIRVRVTFDRGMLDDGKLNNAVYYSVLPKFPTGAPVTVVSVTPQGIAEPTYVDLVVTEMTDGETYTAEVQATTGPTDPTGTPFGPSTNTYEFAGTGVDPTIDSVTSTGINEVEVAFSEPMDDNATINDSARYSFDNSLNVLSVLSVVGDIVTLVTDDQVPGLLYTLTVTQP